MNKNIRNKFVSSWDDMWDKILEDDSFEELSQNEVLRLLKRELYNNNFKWIGKLKDVQELKPDDAITPSDSEDFFSFVEDDLSVENPGGKDIRGLTSRDKLDQESDVWRYMQKDIKLSEIFDPIGFAVSKRGNMTKVQKSFYFRNKQKYSSPFFEFEQDAWKWRNHYYGKEQNNAKSTLTLYEMTNEVVKGVKQDLEDKIARIISLAEKNKKISKEDIDAMIMPVLKKKGQRAVKEFNYLLDKYHIEVVDDLEERYESERSGIGIQDEVQYSGGYTKCEKCGSENLSTGIETEGERKGDWFHRCMKCKHKMYIDNKKDVNEMSTVGAVAGFNAPMFGSEDIYVNKKNVKSRHKKKDVLKRSLNEIVSNKNKKLIQLAIVTKKWDELIELLYENNVRYLTQFNSIGEVLFEIFDPDSTGEASYFTKNRKYKLDISNNLIQIFKLKI